MKVSLFWSKVNLTASVVGCPTVLLCGCSWFCLILVSLESCHRKRFALKARQGGGWGEGRGAWLALKRRPCAEPSRNGAICHPQPCSGSGELANLHGSEGGTGPFSYYYCCAVHAPKKVFQLRTAFWDVRFSVCCPLAH